MTFVRSPAGEWTSDDHRRFISWLVAYELHGAVEGLVMERGADESARVNERTPRVRRIRRYIRDLRAILRIVNTGSSDEVSEAIYKAWFSGTLAFPGQDETALRVAGHAVHEVLTKKDALHG